jgi:hypothetical protein
MKTAGAVLAVLAVIAVAAPAQNVTVAATGTLSLSWQGSGPLQTSTQPVQGTTTLQNTQVGSVALTVGTTTTLTLTALSPPWPGPTMGWWSSATGDVRLRLTAGAPVAGVLRVGVVPACIAGSPPFVDVEDDGLLELVGAAGPAQTDVPVVLGLRPVTVRLYGSMVNFGATCAGSVSVEFVPQPANLATAGIACGPSLAATLLRPTAQPGRLTLHVDDQPNAPSSTFAALAFGATALAMGPTCGAGLLADGWVFVTPTAGGFDLPIPLAPALVGAVELQHVGLQLPWQLQWSNRVRLSLP